MAFRYVSTTGVSRLVTSASIRRALLTSDQSLIYGSELGPSGYALPGNADPLDSFLGKVYPSTRAVNSEDIVRSIDEFLGEQSSEVMPFMLALERVHFIAVFYLIHERLISASDLRNMLDVPYSTRSQYLLGFLSREQDPGIFTRFLETLARFYVAQKPEGFEESRVSGIVSPAITSTVNKEQFRFFERYAREHMGLSDPFPFVDFDFWSLAATFRAYRFASGTESQKASAISLNQTIYDDIKNDSEGDSVSLRDSFSMMINKYLPPYCRNVKQQAAKRPSENFSVRQSMMDYFTKKSTGYAVDNNTGATKPFEVSLFNWLYWIHQDTSGINAHNTDAQAFFDEIDFDVVFTKGADLRDNIGSNSYDFSYLNSRPRFKSFMLDLFPQTASNPSRSSLAYATRYFARPSSGGSSTFSSNAKARRAFMDVANLDLRVASDSTREIASLGSANKNSFFLRLISEALAANSITQTPLSELATLSFSDVSTYVSSLSSAITSHIASRPSEGNYYDDIIRTFFSEFVSDYLSFLLDPSRSVYRPRFLPDSPSANDNFRFLRVLRTIRQLFFNVARFVGDFKGQRIYDAFVLMLRLHDEPESKYFSTVQYFSTYDSAKNTAGLASKEADAI